MFALFLFFVFLRVILADRLHRRGRIVGRKGSAEVDSSAVEQIYGQDAVRDVVRKRLQIALLTREQMDNDAVLELFDSEPTYNRSSDFKQRLAVAGTVRPNESNATSESGTKTINFGD